jgi:peptidyl-prolyl cis-trans isomerase C
MTQFNFFRHKVGNAAMAALFAVFLAGSAVPSFAQDEIVATVDNMEITARELEFTRADLAEQFQQLPEDQRNAAMLRALIDIKLIARAAENAGLAESAEFQARVQFLRERALHNNYFQQEIAGQVTDEEVRARYESEIAKMPAQEEVRARHILLETEEAAKTVIEQLEAGESFAELAKTESTGPSGPQGGDLGFFGKGQMVAEFDQVVFALANGEYTKEPVQTQFGWHVILREESRTQSPPEFEAVEAQVRQIVIGEKYAEMISRMREEADIEILDESLKPATESTESQ